MFKTQLYFYNTKTAVPVQIRSVTQQTICLQTAATAAIDARHGNRTVAPGVRKTGFYIASTSRTAVVFVRNASALASDLTIVTRHPIVISGGFNVQGTPHAASLVTAQRVFAVP